MSIKLKETDDTETGDKKHLVAFLDILGFKNHVQKYLDGDKKVLYELNTVYEKSLEAVQNVTDFFEDKGFYKDRDLIIRYKQFSDCTCLNIPLNGNLEVDTVILCGFINMLKVFCYNMIVPGLYLIRGGLSVGFHYENNNMIFSEGLIKAYELESKTIYPRIVLDDELIKLFKKIWEDPHLKKGISLISVDKLLVLDWDESVFINPFYSAKFLENIYSNGIKETPFFIDEKQDLKAQLTELDDIINIGVFEDLQGEIRDLRHNGTDKDVLKKYIWLKELIKWNIDPDSSKIKFEYLLK